MAWGNQKIMLGLTGNASSSTGTSNPIFVGDCRLITISVQTGSNTSASNVTISLSNNQGLNSTDSTFFWSTVTVLPNQGIFTIDPAARWIRAERANFAMTSVASNTTVMLNRYYEGG